MKFTFTDKKISLPDNVHAYAEKKVTKLDRYFKADAEAHITFCVEKNRNHVELTVRSGATFFRAEESTSDMFASIDAAVGTIEGQIRKNKTRLAKRLRTDAFSRTADAVSASFVTDDAEEEYRVTRTKRFPMKPMTVEEAILQMNLLGHAFFAFRNEDNGGGFAVVYLRKDGDYGLIEDNGEE